MGELFRKLPVFGVRETPDEWLATLARVPMLRQPGEAWLYNTCSDIQGAGRACRGAAAACVPLGADLRAPGDVDTSFFVPDAKRGRLAPYHSSNPALGDSELWNEPPVFPSGAGGLVSTLADWHRFAQMLLAGGKGLLLPDSVTRMMTNHLTDEQRDEAALFLEGDGWGFGARSGLTAATGWGAPGRPRTSRPRRPRSASCSRRSR